MLSDAFQIAWWSQTNLRKGKSLTVIGAAGGGTVIQVSSTWASSVRNTTNGNQRTYGPWANQPSPSILFPVIANPALGGPAAFSLIGVRAVGTKRHGKDPIPYLGLTELNGSIMFCDFYNFANWGEVIMGSFNMNRLANQWEANAAQPSEVGVTLGGQAGWVTPRVVFDYDATTNTVSAKAGTAFDTYAAGDPVPFFQTSQVGRTFCLHQAAFFGAVSQPLKATIASVSGDGVSTATLTVPGSVIDRTVTDTAGSFTPVRVTTTASNAQVTLSSPIVAGDGAADMIGQLVSIPKAGSSQNSEIDVFTSRVISCDTGSDSAGYTVLTLAEAPPNAVSGEAFIWSACHATVRDEATLAAGAWNIDDSDFIKCRYTKSDGFGDDLEASAYMAIIQDSQEAVQYTDCKIHGMSPDRSGFACDGQVILDHHEGLVWLGVDVTHQGFAGGSVRMMGARMIVQLSANAVGGWQLAHDWSPWFLDPQTGFDAKSWSVRESDTRIKYNESLTSWPYYSQAIWGRQVGLSAIDAKRLTSDRDQRDSECKLTTTDDLNDVDLSGDYSWTGGAPLNAPQFANNCILRVYSTGSHITQELKDITNAWEYTRESVSGVWGGWRLQTIRAKTNDAFVSSTNELNNLGKYAGLLARNTDDNKLYVAQGSAALDVWISADGATTLTPMV